MSLSVCLALLLQILHQILSSQIVNRFLSSSFTARLYQFSGKRNLWVRFFILDLIVSSKYNSLNKTKEIVVTTTAMRRPTTTATGFKEALFFFFQSLSCRCCWSSVTWSLNWTWRSEQHILSQQKLQMFCVFRNLKPQT